LWSGDERKRVGDKELNTNTSRKVLGVLDPTAAGQKEAAARTVMKQHKEKGHNPGK
jgi:hypothetical protein